jgi:hypothetical protein
VVDVEVGGGGHGGDLVIGCEIFERKG